MEPWFDQQFAAKFGAILGTSLGIVGGIVGCSLALCIRKGYKKLVYTVFAALIIISAGLLITGLAALLLKQPYHVWYPLCLPGFIGTSVFTPLLFVIRNRFIQIELRQMQAKDL